MSAEASFAAPTSRPARRPVNGPSFSAKTEGVSPGFTVRDSRGVRWFVDFDAAGIRERRQAPPVAMRLFWARGYNQTEIHFVRRGQPTQFDDKATIETRRRHRAPCGEGCRRRVQSRAR